MGPGSAAQREERCTAPGAESDFTTAIKPIEKAAGVVVGGAKGGHAAK
jgi:hypothetical protein